MKKTPRIIITLIVIDLCVLAVALYYRHLETYAQPTSAPSSSTLRVSDAEGIQPSASSSAQTFPARAVIAESNAYRAKKSLPALSESPLLTKSACAKANDMIARNYWSHQSPEGDEPWEFFKASGYGYQNAGENLAYGQTSAQQVVDQWIKSSTHEKNLSGNFTETGICTLFAPHYQGGSYIITVAHYGLPQ